MTSCVHVEARKNIHGPCVVRIFFQHRIQERFGFFVVFGVVETAGFFLVCSGLFAKRPPHAVMGLNLGYGDVAST